MSDGRIVIDTQIDNSGAERGIGELNKKAQDGLSTMNKAFLATTVAVAGIGVASFKVGSDFEEGMSKVAAISGATGDELKALTEKAKEMGAKTKFSATESAEAMQYMAMAGWKSQQMIEGLPGIMNLAAASGEELGLVSDIVTDALTAFGMEAKDSAEFADLLASAASNSNTNVSMLGESFKYVAPVAGALGMSAKDSAFALGLMANAGIKGSQSGTALRASLTNLAKPTDAMAAEMDKLGISLLDANGNVKDGKALYDELREKFSGLTDAQKTQSAATIFGKEAMSGMLSIINASEEDYNKLYDSLNNSSGAAEEMANVMNDNLKGSLTLLGSALEGAGIAFYEKFSGPAKEVVDNVAAWFSDLTTKLGNGELDNTLSGIATALATVGTGLLVFNVVTIVSDFIAVMKGAAAATKLVASAQKALNAIMAMSTMGWIVIGISALVAAFITLWNTNEDFRNAVTAIWNGIKDFFINTWNAIASFFTETIPAWIESMKQWFSDLGAWFGELWTNIKQWFVDGWNSIVTFFTESIPAWWEGVKQAFADGWNAVVAFFTETIPAWIESMFNWFMELPDKIAYAMGFVLQTIINWGVDTWSYLLTNVPIWIDAVIEWFASLPGKIWAWLLNVIAKVVEWGTQTYWKMVEYVANSVNAVIDWFAKLPGRIWEWLSNAVSKAVQWGQETYWKMVEAVANAINAVIEWFAKLPGRIWEWLVNTVKKVIDWGANLAKSGAEAGGKLVTGIIDIVKDLPKKFMDIGVNIVKGIWEGIKSVGSWLHDRVTGFFDNMLQGAQDANKIKSPSRLYRDEVGKYMAQGVGVGFEDEADNVQKSMEKEFNKMAGKMQLAVDYNMASTTAGIVARNSNYGTSTDIGITDSTIENKAIIEVPLILEGREVARAVAPYQGVFTDYNKGR